MLGSNRRKTQLAVGASDLAVLLRRLLFIYRIKAFLLHRDASLVDT